MRALREKKTHRAAIAASVSDSNVGVYSGGSTFVTSGAGAGGAGGVSYTSLHAALSSLAFLPPPKEARKRRDSSDADTVVECADMARRIHCIVFCSLGLWARSFEWTESRGQSSGEKASSAF
jgi:hypothetical protein